MAGKLSDKELFRQRVQSLLASPPAWVFEWHQRLENLLVESCGAGEERLKNRDFLKRLFDDTTVSATGPGNVIMAPALDNEEFVDWFAENASKPLPEDDSLAEIRLDEFHEEAASRLVKLCGRRPMLKLNRALCALYPYRLTTLAAGGPLRVLYKETGGARGESFAHMHFELRRRIDEAIGSRPVDLKDNIRRMCLPWLLFDEVNKESPNVPPPSHAASDDKLEPLPPALRRKGLTAIKGYFQTLLGYLPALDGDGLTYDEFCDVIRQSNPTLVESSVRTVINVVMREFDLCRRNGEVYQLSARGIDLLESQDPQELADQLLTKVLGVDYTIRELSHAPKSKAELVAFLQTVNPGWTTAFAPTALLGWLVSLEVISYAPSTGYSLTETGRRWDELITWEPPKLPKVGETVVEIQTDLDSKLVLPEWATLKLRLADSAAGKLRWDNGLVEQLHAGLWFHPVRHFAVMAGLSGSGKTQLAVNYADALCGEQPIGQESVKVIPIQPGWFDTSPLLGYVHPIQQNTYIGTPFLDLILRAAENPTTPHVAILDEMNLSHPEQYLAPILSAMETLGLVELHSMDEEACGVPNQIKYPANLALIGTVNMDETTHGLSDKVLDRAYTLEFWDIDVAKFPGWSVLDKVELRQQAQTILQELMAELAPIRLHFGWRTIDDVVNYLAFSAGLGISGDVALDDVLYAKVLPKLRGESSARFLKAMEGVRNVCIKHDLKRCKVKVASMMQDLTETGSTRFWR
ncbi:TPA: hypothetical protein QDA96_002041 [Burkholderia vietnamiensis]|uniref:McrB family protein n=1 Tax=Burkholderia vietnamiensis TaxID=60552 RepID=UPI000A4E5088|nr:hypothetical protein [Burkholderia vietnamiensis]MBR8016514.1 hypothetical protein [Burkholderia vietnamiensis]CAG9190204.1 putative enzyme [Burkholderia vietnamiensis]HDR8923397.1 hypothetical protein [Burkholderia vietnamiensis]HDR8980883.1 hypothetical protein [Burkholderia vietnamiensis]HDR9041380.1 hypothetical protein [Burkholderia vietnamiensis]